MTLREVERAGQFAWRPRANLIYTRETGVIVLQVDDIEGAICAVVPAGPLPT